MSNGTAQAYATHRRWVPMYHFVASALLFASLVYAVWNVITSFSLQSVMHLVLVLAVIIVLYPLFLVIGRAAAADPPFPSIIRLRPWP